MFSALTILYFTCNAMVAVWYYEDNPEVTIPEILWCLVAGVFLL